MQKADDAKEDVSAMVNSCLDVRAPRLGEVPWERVINKGNIHGDFRIKLPKEEALIGYTCTPPRIVLQFLQSGELIVPLRDKLLQHEMEDNFPVVRKAKQPMPWLTIVTPQETVFEAEPGEVGGTAETGGKFIFKTKGLASPGILKSDYHEWYFWFDPPYESLSGRWGIQKIAANPAYARVPGDVEWWMMNKPYVNQEPYITSKSREATEKKAKAEKLKGMSYNPELLDTLASDTLGKKILSNIDMEKLAKVKAEYSAGGATWPPNQGDENG